MSAIGVLEARHSCDATSAHMWSIKLQWAPTHAHAHTHTHTHTHAHTNYLQCQNYIVYIYVGPKLQQHTHTSLCSHYQTAGYAYQYSETEVSKTNTVGPLVPLDPAVSTWFRGVPNSEVRRFIHISAYLAQQTVSSLERYAE